MLNSDVRFILQSGKSTFVSGKKSSFPKDHVLALFAFSVSISNCLNVADFVHKMSRLASDRIVKVQKSIT